MNVWPVLLSWRMAWVAACRWVKPNIYAALHANNWSPKNIPSYGYRKRTRRRSLTSHEERRMDDDAWSSLLLHQKLRPVQQIDARAGRGASGSLVHLAPALLPGTGDCLLVDRYASASWRNHLDRQPRMYVDSSSGCPPWIDVRGLLCLHRMVCWLQDPTIWKRVHRKFAL